MGSVINFSRGNKVIKLTYEQIRNPDFLAIGERIHSAKMAFRSAKRIADIFSKIKLELEAQRKAFDALIEKHMDDVGGGAYKIKEGVEHEQVLKEFLATPVEIHMPRITPQELFHVELTPHEVKLLDGLIEVE